MKTDHKEKVDDILVDNLRDALQQIQRYLIYGIMSAVLLVLLILDTPELIEQEQKFIIPTFGEVDPGPGAIIFIIAYITFGVLASTVIVRIRRIGLEITDEKMLDAALARFYLVTIDNKVIRVAAMLLAPLIVSISLLIERFRSVNPLDVSSAVWLVLGFGLVALPYLYLAFQLWKPLKDMPRHEITSA